VKAVRGWTVRNSLRFGAALALFLPALSGAGCKSTTTKYIHPNVDLGAIRRVAVLPFENLSPDRSAGEKLQKLFLTEVLSLDAFEVVEPGQVVRELKALRIESLDAVGPAETKRLGEALKADGFFFGSVVDFAEMRSGSTPTPQVTIALRLVEAASGVTVWSASRTTSGATASARLFGIGGESLTEAARQLMREELSTLVKK
jgi:TolB-like protein